MIHHKYSTFLTNCLYAVHLWNLSLISTILRLLLNIPYYLYVIYSLINQHLTTRRSRNKIWEKLGWRTAEGGICRISSIFDRSTVRYEASRVATRSMRGNKGERLSWKYYCRVVEGFGILPFIYASGRTLISQITRATLQGNWLTKK